MTKIISNAMMLALVAAGAFGCGDDTMSGTMNTDMSASQFSSAPTLKSQIDRMGRAAINTALTDPFYTDSTAHNTKLDAYNKAPRSMWPSFIPQFSASLAVFDGIDGVCDNQPLASVTADAGGEYSALAGILADDELLLDTSVGSCDSPANYLAVEVGVITKTASASCGGRTPLDNSIDTSYAVLSGGIVSRVAVTNGVTIEGDASNSATITTFPFLGAPL